MGIEVINDGGPVTNSRGEQSDSGTDGLTAQKMNPNLVAGDTPNQHEGIIVDDEQKKDLKSAATGIRNNHENLTLMKKDNTILHESNKITVDTGPPMDESATLEAELSKRDDNNNAQMSFDLPAYDFVQNFATEPNTTTFALHQNGPDKRS